jgi:hypothetical protein
MSPATRAFISAVVNPQLTLWAKICRQLRWLQMEPLPTVRIAVDDPDFGVESW